jgi:hypothetical protein
LASGQLEEVHDVEFDETNGSQEQDENLEDVSGSQLTNAMKNMDIGDIRPRQVIDIQDDKDQVLPSPNKQASSSQVQDQDGASTSQVVQPNVQASASQQVQVLQPTNVARDHPLDHMIEDIQSCVQTRSRVAYFCEHYSFVSSIEPTKIG